MPSRVHRTPARVLRTALVALFAAVIGVAFTPGTSVPARAAVATFPQATSCAEFSSYWDKWTPTSHRLYADETWWVPQGLTYDPARDWLIVSYYDGRNGVPSAEKYQSMLAVLDRATGAFIKSVYLHPADVKPGGHVGGVAVGRDTLYVASTDTGRRVTAIPLDTIAAAPEGSTLPDSASYPVAAASYATFHDGQLYVGDFENDVLYAYDTTAEGVVAASPAAQYPTPTLVQGVAINDDSFFFSRSYGRTRISYLTKVERDTGDTRSTVLPNMSQGIVWAPGDSRPGTDLYVLYESGSAAYGPQDDGGASTCRTHWIWHAPRSQLR